jgi:hypothetical protein
MTTESRAARAGFLLFLAATAGVGVAAPVRAAPTERFAEREGLACSACHVGTDGGALNELGRDYRFKAPFLEDAIGGGGASTSSFAQDSADAADSSDGAPLLGRFSGELAWYGRRGRTRAFDRRITTWSVTEALRLRGDALFGDESLSFRGDAFASQGDGEGGFPFDPHDDDSLGFTAAEVTWRGDARGSFVRFGRQFVVAGAATRRVDGAALRHPLGETFELDLFGGAPAEDGRGDRGGDLIAGGRLGARLGRSLRIGGSAFYAKDHSDPAKVKGGIDLQWTPTRHLEVASHFHWDWLADQLHDARVHAVVSPSVAWQVAVDWIRSVPGLFLPKSSLYSGLVSRQLVATGANAPKRASRATRRTARKPWRTHDDMSRRYSRIRKTARNGPGRANPSAPASGTKKRSPRSNTGATSTRVRPSSSGEKRATSSSAGAIAARSSGASAWRDTSQWSASTT